MEVMNNVENVKTQMRRGVLEYCILSILSKKDSYASSILSELKDARMIVVEGTIYPLLIRQKNQGLLTYRWEAGTRRDNPTFKRKITVFEFFRIYKNATSC